MRHLRQKERKTKTQKEMVKTATKQTDKNMGNKGLRNRQKYNVHAQITIREKETKSVIR